jgi:hypothetical protein
MLREIEEQRKVSKLYLRGKRVKESDKKEEKTIMCIKIWILIKISDLESLYRIIYYCTFLLILSVNSQWKAGLRLAGLSGQKYL